MDMLKNLNAAVRYIDENLCGEIDIERAALTAGITADSLLRFFSYMTGMTLNEYIHRRRLTLAADDIRAGKDRVVDIAVKYGYDSADAFSRAFAKQHGITPSAYRKNGGELQIYPPASLHIIIKGARKMAFKTIKLPETKLFGISERFDGEGYDNREELRHAMWSDSGNAVPNCICLAQWNEKGSIGLDGVWYGIWQDGRYMITREEADVKAGGFETRVLLAGTYAAFKTERGWLAWEEFPKLFGLIFDSWLPTSGYKQKCELAIEVLHLWTDREIRCKNRWYEVWIPIEPVE